MTQEERQLLLKDLSARLPYGVIVETYWEFKNKKDKTFPKSKLTHSMLGYYIGEDKWKYNTHFLPFLRPMSSMTEEEKKEFDKLINLIEERCINAYGKGGYTLAFTELNDWLNAHHFDYRGLIEKGLALKAPDGMYDIGIMTDMKILNYDRH